MIPPYASEEEQGVGASFTPGPWEASLEAVRFVIQHVPDHGMGKRALAYTGGSEPANPFNAHLIAAAPELYEALSEQVDACFDPLCEMCIRHQRILNKARGNSTAPSGDRP